jgi:hypothetical protein
MNQKQAERFVVAWCHSKSAEETAAKLGKPILVVLKIARHLRKMGVTKLPYRPVETPQDTFSLN